MKISKNQFIITLLLILSISTISAFYILRNWSSQKTEILSFNGDRAFTHAAFMVNLGPRTLESSAHQQAQDYIRRNLNQNGWIVEDSKNTSNHIDLTNIIGKHRGGEPWILIGAHYDSRFYADQDPDPTKQKLAVPGANDGASGVGVLLELANIIPNNLDKEVWLVFFDGEDNGNIQGYDWILGSQAFAANLTHYPDAVIILDMIGDKDLDIYKEMNSDPELTQEIWSVAEELGVDAFIPVEKYRILDDHLPFRDLGISAVDIIDFDYPYWHTTEDTLDKISAESLEKVGKTIFAWILK